MPARITRRLSAARGPQAEAAVQQAQANVQNMEAQIAVQQAQVRKSLVQAPHCAFANPRVAQAASAWRVSTADRIVVCFDAVAMTLI
jgi:multidrug resistance efflux pump